VTSAPTPLVVVLGDVLVDVVVRPSDRVAAGSDTPCRTTWRQGGAAASTAAWLARLGAAVRLVGRVGNDLAGRSVAEELGGLGVDARLAVDPDEPTGTVVALVHDGDRDMYTSRGASSRLTPDDLVAGWLDGAAHLHLSGYVLLDDTTRPAGRAALQAAERAGVGISVDVSSAAPLRDVGAEAFLSWLPQGTVVKGNADEATVLTGRADHAGAARAIGVRTGEAVVTCGSQGSLWSDGTAVVVRRVLHPVGGGAGPHADPVGAGDAFTAGLLEARVAGADVAVQLRRGAEVAAAAVARGVAG
jgi:ribokinase